MTSIAVLVVAALALATVQAAPRPAWNNNDGLLQNNPTTKLGIANDSLNNISPASGTQVLDSNPSQSLNNNNNGNAPEDGYWGDGCDDWIPSENGDKGQGQDGPSNNNDGLLQNNPVTKVGVLDNSLNNVSPASGTQVLDSNPAQSLTNKN